MTQIRPTLFISHSSKDKEWAERMREALRGEGYGAFLDSHPDDGIHPGAEWEQTLWRRLRQSGGVVVLCTANWLASPWCVAEVMIAREQGKTVFLLATADVADSRQVKGTLDGDGTPQFPDFLKDTQFMPLAGLTVEETYGRLWRGLAEEGLKEDFAVPERPYPGLEPFEERDAAVFFGRKDEITRVREVLNQRRLNNANGFILVLGASGCGKSSLVRPGVLPRLKRASDKDGSIGRRVIPPPFFGREGLEDLVRSFAHAFDDAGQPDTPSSIRQRLIPAPAATGEAECDVRALRELASDLLSARRLPNGYLPNSSRSATTFVVRSTPCRRGCRTALDRQRLPVPVERSVVVAA